MGDELSCLPVERVGESLLRRCLLKDVNAEIRPCGSHDAHALSSHASPSREPEDELVVPTDHPVPAVLARLGEPGWLLCAEELEKLPVLPFSARTPGSPCSHSPAASTPTVRRSSSAKYRAATCMPPDDRLMMM